MDDDGVEEGENPEMSWAWGKATGDTIGKVVGWSDRLRRAIGCTLGQR